MLLQLSAINSLFQFMGVDFKKQFLHYGDFDPPLLGDDIFQGGYMDRERIDTYDKSQFHNLGHIWQQYSKTPLVKQLGYQNALGD